MLQLFLKFELEKTVKYFRTKTVAKLITSFLFVLVFLFVGTGIYFFFVSGFRSINIEATPDIRLALTIFLYELFLIILAGVIVFSCIISSIFSLFRGGYNNWVISSPSYKVFPTMIFIKSLMASFLPSLIMFLPAIFAFIKVYNLGIISLVFIAISVVLLIMLLNSATLLMVVLVSSLYYKLTKYVKFLRFTLGGLIGLLMCIIAGVITFLWKTVSTIDLVKLFKADENTDVLNSVNISNHFASLPTHPFAMEIVSWQNGLTKDALINFLTLFVFAFISVVLWSFFSHLFYPLWQKFQEGKSSMITKNSTSPLLQRTYYFAGSNILALFKKEALISSRNWKGVLWFMFLSSIWIAQIGTNVVLGSNVQRYQTDISHKMITLQAIQFIIAIYFICSFALRFVFTSFSVEKKTAWILASAPLSFNRIFFGKYLFYTLFFVTIGILMSCVNISVLNLSFIHAFNLMLLFVTTIIFIVSLALSLGALFPSLDTDDPEVISTSMPGLFFTALALIYGALSDWMLYLSLTSGHSYWIIAFIVITLVFTVLLITNVPTIAKKKSYQ